MNNSINIKTGIESNVVPIELDASLASQNGWNVFTEGGGAVSSFNLNGVHCTRIIRGTNGNCGLSSAIRVFDKTNDVYSAYVDVYPVSTGTMWFRLTSGVSNFVGNYNIDSSMLNRWNTIKIEGRAEQEGEVYRIVLFCGTVSDIYISNLVIRRNEIGLLNNSLSYNILPTSIDASLQTSEGWITVGGASISEIDGVKCLMTGGTPNSGARSEYIFEGGKSYTGYVDVYPLSTGLVWFRIQNSSGYFVGNYNIDSSMLNRWNTIKIHGRPGVKGEFFNFLIYQGSAGVLYFKNARLHAEGVEINDFSCSSEYMGESVISGEISYGESQLPEFSLDWETLYKGKKYILTSSEPSSTKNNDSLLYRFNILLKPQYEIDLNRHFFIDVVDRNDLSRGLYDYNFSFTGTFSEFISRLALNIQYYYGEEYAIDLNPSLGSDESQTIQFDSTSILSVINFIYEKFGIEWDIKTKITGVNNSGLNSQNVIYIGYGENDVEHIFSYRDGLSGISKTDNTNDIITQLYFDGTSDNLPLNYLSNRYSDEMKDPDGSSDSTFVKRKLLGESARLSIRGWNDARDGKTIQDYSEAYLYGFNRYKDGERFNVKNFITSENAEKYGIISKGIDISDIKPTLQGATHPTLGRLDEIIAVEQVTNDDHGKEEKEYTEIIVNENKTVLTSGESFVTGIDFGNITVSKPINNITTSISVKANCAIRSAIVNIEWLLIENEAIIKRISSKNYTLENDITNCAGTANGSLEPDSLVDYFSVSEIEYPGSLPGTYQLRADVSVSNVQVYGNIASGFGPAISCSTANIIVVGENKPADTFKQTYDIWIKDIGFNLNNSDYWATEDAAVLYSDGLLAGSDEYRIVKYVNDNGETVKYAVVETDLEPNTAVEKEDKEREKRYYNGIPSKYKITLEKIYPEEDVIGVLPNINVNQKAGDHFYFVNIQMPYDPYVYDAERKLEQAAWEYLNENDESILSYNITLDKLEAHSYNIKEGSRIRVFDKTSTEDVYQVFYVNNITESSKYNRIGNVTISVSNTLKLPQGFAAKIREGLELMSSGSYGQGSTIIGDRRYLRKDIPDIAFAHISFRDTLDFYGDVTIHDNMSIKTSNYDKGQFGGNGAVVKEHNGRGYIETDDLVVRGSLIVNELVVNQILFNSGNQVFTAAGIEVSRVEVEGTSYTCFIDVEEGRKTVGFRPGDLAMCQRYNSSSTAVVKYYWMMVTAVGEDSITLSPSSVTVEDSDGEFETYDAIFDTEYNYPEEGDHVVQLGNVSDKSRQGAIIFDILREGGPKQSVYANINAYTLTDKNYIELGVTEDTAEFVAYGSSYVGARDMSSYVRYTEDGGLEVKGKITATNPDENSEWWGMIGNAKVLFQDIAFTRGYNSVSAPVELEVFRVQSSTPTGSGWALDVRMRGNYNQGILSQSFTASPSGMYACLFVAKLPAGSTINYNTDSDPFIVEKKWITNNVGTGEFETYAYIVKTIDSYSYIALGAIFVENNTPAIIASQTVYDLYNINEQDKSTVNEIIDRLNLWANDGYISPSEKTYLIQIGAIIDDDYNYLYSTYEIYGQTSSSYLTLLTSAYNLAKSAITKYTASSPENIVVNADYAHIASYWAQSIPTTNWIESYIKSYTDDIIKELDLWASDGYISPTEKESLRLLRYQIIYDFQSITFLYTLHGQQNSDPFFSISLYYDEAIDAILWYTRDEPENIPVDSDYNSIAIYFRESKNAKNYINEYINDKISSYSYLAEALKGTTTIQGGLVLSNVLAVRNGTIDNLSSMRAGISGQDSDGVAFFAHSTDAYRVANEFALGNSSVRPNFLVTKDGKLYANDADIYGVINATSGTFTGTVYAENGEFNGVINASNGKFTSSSTDTRSSVLISSDRNTSKISIMYDDVEQATFGVTDYQSGSYIPVLRVGSYTTMSSYGYAEIGRRSISLTGEYAMAGSYSKSFGVSTSGSYLSVNMYGLPTSQPDIRWQVWVDSNGYLRLSR